MQHTTRRGFLGTAGAVGAASLAGCAETTSEQGPDEVDASGFTGLEEWLETDEVGGVADNFDGTVLDYRNLDAPTITVGAEGNGGSLAFDPVAVVASTDQSVKWEWSGEGEHNVVAKPGEQLDMTRGEFDSGEPAADPDPFYHGTGRVMTCFYQCEEHVDQGMKGAVMYR